MANGDGYKSTQKLPKHHSHASQTQDSYDYGGTKAYKDGAKAGRDSPVDCSVRPLKNVRSRKVVEHDA